MRLIRFGRQGGEKPGVVLDGKRKDLSAYFRDWNSTFFAESGLEKLLAFLKTDETRRIPEVSEGDRWGSPVARPGKIVCAGLNFSDHAKESGMPVPTKPVLFLKATDTVVGPFDDILIPRNSNKTDWEVELGLIIAREARYLNSVGDAAPCIAGYCISHDVSEREFQLERGGQWSKGKSCDTFNPLGPWLTTSDELTDVSKLRMTLLVNGGLMQNGSTETMIFSPAQIVHYISQFMTLEPGDLISTGTPPGVGLGMKPPRYLRHGDIVELEIHHLGKQRQRCRQV
jgi:2,4-diketo-3-deoxy-L-fuconate hydrolase